MVSSMSAVPGRDHSVLFRTLVEQLPIVVYVDRLDETSSPIYLSPQIEELTGYPAEAFERDSGLYIRLVHPDDRDRYLKLIERRNRDAVPASGEYRLIRKDGRIMHLLDGERVLVDDRGRPLYAQGYLLDVSEQHGYRVRLEAINAVLGAFSSGAPPHEIVRRGIESLARGLGGVRTSFVAVERGYRLRFLDTASDCSLPPLPRDLVDLSEAPAFFDALERGDPVLSSNGSRSAQFGTVFEQIGGSVPAAFVDVPVSRAGRLLGVLSIDSPEPRTFTPAEIQSLTEVGRQLAAVLLRERAEVDLRRRDEILSTVSRAAAVLLAGSSWEDATPGLLESLGRATRASRAYVFRLERTADGELRASRRFEWSAAGVSAEIDNPLLNELSFARHGLDEMLHLIERNEVFTAHVRELPEAARELLESQAIVSLLTVPIVVDGAPWGFVGLDECADEREWSAAETDALRAASSLLGAAVVRQRSEAMLREQEQKLRAVFEASFDAIFITDSERRYVDMNPAAAELYGLDRDEMIGRRIDDFVTGESRPTVAAGWSSFVADPVTTGTHDLTRPDGTVRQIEYSARPGFLPGLNIAFVRDVTEQRELETRLHAARRLESMGRLAGGVAHDFNNLLTAIGGYTALALERAEGHPALVRDLSEIGRAADRAAGLTRQLLAFGRRQVLQPRTIELGEVVRGVESMLGRLLGEHVAIDLRLDADAGRVLADPGQLEQVIVNLAVNARDAMPDGGTLSISSHATERNGRAFVALEVSDTGIGMDAETRARAFEPFFTTRQEGVGLGLATVYGIVTQSGGDLELTSEPGRGSTFTVLLPRTDVPTPPEPAAPPEVAPHGSETVLLVEDEDVVRALARRVLEQHGYRVLESRNGHEAIGVAETHEGEIDVLLTDVVMPGLRGHEVADRVAATRPGIRVVYMSGYADETLLGRAADGRSSFLEKPFSNDALARRVREALGADTGPPG
jgi:PAS domain S-box-containing protein